MIHHTGPLIAGIVLLVVVLWFSLRRELRLRARLAQIDSVLATVHCVSVEDLKNQYLEEMRRFNERDLPPGYDSWETYHREIVALRDEVKRLRKLLGQKGRTPP